MNRIWVAALCAIGIARAEPPETPETDEADDNMVVHGERLPNPFSRDRVVTRVTRKDMARRLVRSTPDALRAAPGAYVQQTGHGQASVYLRGRTGQQVLLMFDGLRINNALFRQGPNQYLFTVDHRTLESIDVVRGSASVTLGADAMAGAIMLRPRSPAIDPTRETHIQPAAAVRYATADEDLGGRAEVDLQFTRNTGMLVGVGLRDVGQLESSGSVGHLIGEDETNVPLFEKEVPTFKDDGRTQLGTGFGELTGDARLLHVFDDDNELAVATYIYRQFNAPRTDQCPPPEANLTECLLYLHQNRTHTYARGDLSPRWLVLDQMELMLGYQRQFEDRIRDSSETLGAITGGKDQIDIWGGRFVGHGRPQLWGPARFDWDYGADANWESVDSSAYIELVRAGIRRDSPRGQYLDDSTYTQMGAWASPRVTLWEDVTLRVGGRASRSVAQAPGNEEAESGAVDQTWDAFVMNAGVAYRPVKGLDLKLSYEQGFRPPNLDDLTGRQPTGRGFQLENPDLVPERAETYEAAIQWKDRWLTLQLWGSWAFIQDTMERRTVVCPESNRECRAARVAVQLTNTSGTSEILALEAMSKVKLPYGFRALGTFAWTEGEGDNPNDAVGGRVPLSRIPPINGVGELRWEAGRTGIYLEGAVRWALDQTDLSVGDVADARIPFGGTPGYVVYDARAGIIRPQYSAYLVVENLTDEPHRTHGSAINGPGRGVILNLEMRP